PGLSRPADQLCGTISVKDVSDLLQYITLRKHHDVKKPRWCHLHQEDRVEKVHMVVLEGVSQLHFYTYYSQFKHLRSKYTTRCTLAPPSGDLLSDLFDTELSAPDVSFVSGSELHTAPPAAYVCSHPVVRHYGMKMKGMSSYLLTEQERIKKNFPVKGGRGFESFVCTQTDDHVTDCSPLYGLDCEMLQRPVSALTLDLELFLAELQNDLQNSNVVYVGRSSRRHHHQDDLLKAFSAFGSVYDITPAEASEKQFVRSDSVGVALDSGVQVGNRKLHLCRSLTPSHMHSWTHTHPVTMMTHRDTAQSEEWTVSEGAEPAGLTCAQDGEMQAVMRRLDRRVGKMFRTMERDALSIVILPGVIRYTHTHTHTHFKNTIISASPHTNTNTHFGSLMHVCFHSDGVEYPGLCFLQVKQV
ncbi:hypothetical protein C0J45_18424, partial [Silurus meridionalis]